MMNLRDKDIIIYAVSCLMDRKNKGLPIGQCVEFDLARFFIATNRAGGGTGYKDFLTSLKRLSGCRISTTIASGGKRHDKEFGLLDTWETYADNTNPPPKTTSETECYDKKDQEKQPVPRGRVRITLSNYLYEAIQGNDVLTLDRRYFLIGNLFSRRLYEIGRKHCGRQRSFRILLDNLREKMGFTSDIYVFRHKIKEHEKKNSLPAYRLKYDREKDLVYFIRRQEEVKRTGEEPQYPEILTEPETTDFYEVTTLPEDLKDIQEPDGGLIEPQKEPIPQKKVAIQEMMPLEVIMDKEKPAANPEDLAAGIQSTLASIEDILAKFKTRDKK